MGRELIHHALLDRLREQTHALQTKLGRVESLQVRDALHRELEDLQYLARVIAPGATEAEALVICEAGATLNQPEAQRPTRPQLT